MSRNDFEPKESAMKLLVYLRQLKKDRGALADLRCLLRPTQRHRAWPLLGRVGGIGHLVYEVVAGLFAYYPDDARCGNLGVTCRLLSEKHSSFEARFQRFLSCDREEIRDRLAPIIFAAKAKGIHVDYEQLFIDLSYWGDRVKIEWARAFWDAEKADIDDKVSIAEDV